MIVRIFEGIVLFSLANLRSLYKDHYRLENLVYGCLRNNPDKWIRFKTLVVLSGYPRGYVAECLLANTGLDREVECQFLSQRNRERVSKNTGLPIPTNAIGPESDAEAVFYSYKLR
jgi:hypothetical protein